MADSARLVRVCNRCHHQRPPEPGAERVFQPCGDGRYWLGEPQPPCEQCGGFMALAQRIEPAVVRLVR